MEQQRLQSRQYRTKLLQTTQESIHKRIHKQRHFRMFRGAPSKYMEFEYTTTLLVTCSHCKHYILSIETISDTQKPTRLYFT